MIALGPSAAQAAGSDSAPTQPLTSAPSEYVEVVPTAGGGAATRPAAGSPNDEQAAPDSAVAAAVDAGESHGALTFGAVVLAVTLVLVGAAAWRRRGAPLHVPKG